MKFEVLLSCMHQKDDSIISKSNLEDVNTLIINQNDNENSEGYFSDKHRVINTVSRGLSLSRNLAIENSEAEICLISDDDEVFVDKLTEIIISSYEKYPDVDVIIFSMLHNPYQFGIKPKILKKTDLLKICSWQISFRRKSILNKVKFDIKLGAGTDNGGGEEHKFLLDCRKVGLKILYVPIAIAELTPNESTWFHGYTEEYFVNLGASSRYILGEFWGLLYIIQHSIRKNKNLRDKMTWTKSFKCLMIGYFKEFNNKY